MSTLPIMFYILCAAVCAGVLGALIALKVIEKRAQNSRIQRLHGSVGSPRENSQTSMNVVYLLLNYMQGLSRRLAFGTTQAILPSARNDRANVSHSASFYYAHARKAGCSTTLSVTGYCEARLRLALMGGFIGAVFGSLISVELAIFLGLMSATLGWMSPPWVLRSREIQRGFEAESCLSEMLEVIALGLHSGLTFDRGLALYGSHFDSEFAQRCAATGKSWSMGLTTRDEALRNFAASYNCDQLSRAIESIIRSLRFGTSLAERLEDIAAEARAEHHARMEERVSKAPVKMMLPTGTLILPAMLLLVLGPILLELAHGF